MTRTEYGAVNGSSVELILPEKKPARLKPWAKALIGLLLLGILALVLVLGIIYSLDMWSGRGKWIHEKCSNVASTDTCPEGYRGTPITLVISCDGFRAKYLLQKVTPTFQRFKECGVTAPYMRSVYPTKTFPNHYAMATGLLPAFNGMVDHTMYDEDIGKVFGLGWNTSYNPAWYLGEPIWNTVTKNNKTSATYFWVASDVAVQGMYPKYYEKYSNKVPFETEVDQVLKWIDLPADKRPNLIMMYFREPDGTGHKYGPYSPEVTEKLKYVDSTIGMLMDGLMDRGLDNCVNVMIVADHGMEETSCDRVVIIDDYVDTTNTTVIPGTYGRISTKYIYEGETVKPVENPRNETEIVEALRCANENLTTTFKWELPKRLHYAYSKRIEDIVMNVDNAWLLAKSSTREVCRTIGQHGYDDIFKSMEAIFFAHGPSFKVNYEVEPFLNIELYNLIAELTNLTTRAPNNGTYGSLHHTLKKPAPLPPPPSGEPYVSCGYPSGDEYKKRSTAQADCTACTLPAGETLEKVDQRLNTDAAKTKASLDKNIPSGTPTIGSDKTVCILAQEDYIHGFSELFHSPVWAAYQLTPSSEVSINMTDTCVRPDVRLPVGVESNCSDYSTAAKQNNMTIGFLHQPELSLTETSKLDSRILSNTVPMYEGFKSGIWQHLMNSMTKWQAAYGPLYIISGPVYDYDYDGHADKYANIKSFLGDGGVPIPTHYYTVITKPSDGARLTNRTNDVMAFLLPHKNTPTTCQSPDAYLLEHSARVKDVELLTGLTFFTKFDRYEALSLETYLMLDLWPYVKSN